MFMEITVALCSFVMVQRQMLAIQRVLESGPLANYDLFITQSHRLFTIPNSAPVSLPIIS